MIGEQIKVSAVDDPTGDMQPYERLMGDAINGSAPVHAPGCQRDRLAHRRTGARRQIAAACLRTRHLGPRRPAPDASERLDRSGAVSFGAFAIASAR